MIQILDFPGDLTDISANTTRHWFLAAAAAAAGMATATATAIEMAVAMAVAIATATAANEAVRFRNIETDS